MPALCTRSCSGRGSRPARPASSGSYPGASSASSAPHAGAVHRLSKSRGGHDEPWWNRKAGARQLAEVGALAAGARDVGHREIFEPDDVTHRPRMRHLGGSGQGEGPFPQPERTVLDRDALGELAHEGRVSSAITASVTVRSLRVVSTVIACGQSANRAPRTRASSGPRPTHPSLVRRVRFAPAPSARRRAHHSGRQRVRSRSRWASPSAMARN